MQNIGEITFNAMVYVFFVAFSGGMGLVVAGLVGFKLFERSKRKAAKGKSAQQKKIKGAF